MEHIPEVEHNVPTQIEDYHSVVFGYGWSSKKNCFVKEYPVYVEFGCIFQDLAKYKDKNGWPRSPFEVICLDPRINISPWRISNANREHLKNLWYALNGDIEKVILAFAENHPDEFVLYMPIVVEEVDSLHDITVVKKAVGYDPPEVDILSVLLLNEYDMDKTIQYFVDNSQLFKRLRE